MALVDSSNVPRGAWVGAIELCNGLWGFHVHLVDPQVLLISVAFPMYQVLEFSSKHVAV